MDQETKKAFQQLGEQLENKFNEIDKKFDLLRFDLAGFKNETMARFDAQDDKIDILRFDLSMLKNETMARFDAQDERIDGLYGHIDGFARMQVNTGTEFAAIYNRQDRLEHRVSRLERHRP